ncbi:MAG: NUDIX domain-containing protein [Spirochaetia bacterium]|jgi:8-oxo-dGTP pyrophosphatase MutT (NUDIX family)|nr:NUDIX domain-containing protein [Spirochaetia bacterium]
MTTLKYNLNQFGGAVIDPTSLPENIDEFAAQLSETIPVLKKENVKVIWMSIPIEKSFLIHKAVEAGFIYHHADSSSLELTLALTDGSFIPPYASHYIGAGGVVLDNDKNLLVIVEKYRGNYKRHYKLPGGTLREGEHISDAVCREVLEETGIRTEFQFLSCLRHWHGYRYGKSDIYFVCRLKPLSHDITIEAAEIEEALWVPVDEYLASSETHPFNKRIVSSALHGKGICMEEITGYGKKETHEMLFSR